MVRNAVGKVMWVGRATVFLVGLAMILTLLFGIATTALAGTGVGGVFNLGKLNTVNAVSKLVGSTDAAMLLVDNNSTGNKATALTLLTEPNKPPMKVSSVSGTATNLSADEVDGLDSDQLRSVGNSDVRNSCDPGSDTNYVTCASTQLTLPAEGRVYLMADGQWRQQSGTADGRCRFFGSGTSNDQVELGGGPAAGSLGLTEVTAPLPAGTHTFGIQCREFSGNTFRFSDMQMSAVSLGGS